jgi:hypothetical protein
MTIYHQQLEDAPMKSMTRLIVSLFSAFAWLIAAPTDCWADETVQIDTSGLSPGFTYAIDFQFALGGPSTSNMATLYGIDFGIGGSAGSSGSIQTFGSVTGNLQSQPITLSGTSGGFAEFTQNFNPGNQLQFTLNMTNNAQLGGNSDTFVFDLQYLDPSSGNWFQIPTSNPNFNNALVEADTDPNGQGQLTFIASSSTDPNFPVPTPNVQPVPTPGSLNLALVGMAALIILKRYRSLRTTLREPQSLRASA